MVLELWLSVMPPSHQEKKVKNYSSCYSLILLHELKIFLVNRRESGRRRHGS
ncbi:MAG: hypothetical protein ACTSUE_00115 [Promethearchaeota archaeon]